MTDFLAIIMLVFIKLYADCALIENAELQEKWWGVPPDPHTIRFTKVADHMFARMHLALLPFYRAVSAAGSTCERCFASEVIQSRPGGRSNPRSRKSRNNSSTREASRSPFSTNPRIRRFPSSVTALHTRSGCPQRRNVSSHKDDTRLLIQTSRRKNLGRFPTHRR